MSAGRALRMAVIVMVAACGRIHFDRNGDGGVDANDVGGEICTANWCWENPPPFEQRTLRAIHGTSATDVWAVGDGGTIRHFDGTAWSRVASPTTDALSAVWAFASDDVRVAARGGVIWRFDGASWAATTTPSPSTVAALYGDPSGSLWAAADAGIVSEDGIALPTVPMRAASTTIHGNGPYLWHGGHFQTVSRWDGVVWNQIQISDFPRAMFARTDGVFVVGNHIWNCSLTLACTMLVANTRLRGIWGAAEADLWAVGHQGALYHYLVGIWTQVTSPTTNVLHAVWGSSTTDAWAVGDGGVILHYDGNAWSLVADQPPPPVGYNAIVVLDDADRWYATPSSLVHEVAGTRTEIPAPTGAVLDDEIEALSSAEVYTTDGTRVLVYDGTSWATSHTLTGPTALAIAQSGELALGGRTNREVWTRPSGGAWSLVFTGTVGEWHGACFPDDGVRAMIVGRSGAGATRMPNGTWMNAMTPTARFLLACDFMPGSPDEVWAVGGDVVLVYRGAAWGAVMYAASTHALLDVLAVSPSQIYVVGLDGALFVGDGSDWREEAIPVGYSLQALGRSPTGTLYVAASGGVILRRRP